jgi:apolipoprotein N-acyltransferase
MNLEKLFSTGRRGDLLAIAIGALLTLAFAPCQLYWLAIIMPAVLFGLLCRLTPNQAFWRSWLFGVGFFGAGVYWIFISIHTYGNASYFLAAAFTTAFIGILALFIGINGYVLNRFFSLHSSTRLFCAFPALWVLFEWLRSWLLTGFPWLFIGYSQINSPLKGYGALSSVYCISFVVLLSSSLLYNIVVTIKQKRPLICGLSILALIFIWVLGNYLGKISWTQPYGAPIKVSLVQGNIPQEIKWSADTVQLTLDTYRTLSEQHWDSKLIIWPESAVPLSMQNAEDFLDEMDNKASQHQSNLITGIPVQANRQGQYYNAVILLGSNKGYYIKRRLVPFGEYVPFSGVLHRLLDVLKIPMSDFIPAGTAKAGALQIDNIKIAAFICYEIAFPELVYFKDNNINMLLTVSNDAWFGHSIAQVQHLEMAQMRALELGRPVLFVSNNGITAIINAKGKILTAAPPYETYVLTDKVQPMQGKTPWQRIGMDPLLFILALLVFTAVRKQRAVRKAKNRDTLSP